MGRFAWRPPFPETLRGKAALKAFTKSIRGLDLLISPQQFELLLPHACKWAEAQEERILRGGEPFSQIQIAAACLIRISR